MLRHLARPSLPVGAVHAEIAQRLRERGAYRHARIERLRRLLEDELDAPAQVARADVAPAPHRAPIEADLPPVGSIRPSTQRPIVVLPEPDFADQCQRLAARDREADAVDRLHQLAAARNGEALDQIGDFKKLAHARASTGKWQRA